MAPIPRNEEAWDQIASFFMGESAAQTSERQRVNRLHRAARARRDRYVDQQ